MVRHKAGFTLVELIIGAAMLAIAITALLGAFLGQVTLNEHARNLTWAINDANRVMEQLRLRNTSSCAGEGNTEPTALPPGFTSWDDWLESAAGGGKSIQPTPNVNERIAVTCQDNATPANRCGTVGAPAQVGTDEIPGFYPAANTPYDPIRVTVAVCWRHRGRTLGECAWDGAQLTPNDAAPVGDGDGVIESPAILSTLMTCRR